MRFPPSLRAALSFTARLALVLLVAEGVASEVHVTSSIVTLPRLDEQRLVALARGIAADLVRRGFEYHDLTPVFREQPLGPEDRLVLPATVLGCHYATQGQRLVAESLGRVLGSI